MKRIAKLSLGTAFMLSVTTSAFAQESITVWWTKPDYASEEEYLNELAERFQAESGIEAEIGFFSSGDMVTKTVAAVEAGEPPDLAFGTTFDSTITPKWAFDDKLVDLTEVFAGREDEFHPPALAGATFLNEATGEKSLYGFPVGQVLRSINYWKSMLEEAGYTEADIPEEWDAFWNFWCDDVQGKLRDEGMRVNAVGQGMSGAPGTSDVYHPFFMALEAYGVKWVNEETGELALDDPAVREGFIKAYDHFTGLYTRGCVPDAATTWDNSDNNTYFHNESTVMTSVASLSIVSRYLDEGDTEIYTDQTDTMGYPNAMDGQPVGNVSQTRSIVIFKDSPNVEGAKQFLEFFTSPEIMQEYDDASHGQVFPSLKVVGERPFWTDPADPHKHATYEIYKDALAADRIIRFPNHFNAALSSANAENVWGRAMGRIIVDDVSVEDAVDELFARLKEITS